MTRGTWEESVPSEHAVVADVFARSEHRVNGRQPASDYSACAAGDAHPSYSLADILCADVKIVDRHRKELYNIESLAASMRQFGCFSAIAVTSDLTLIGGERRLAAAKLAEIKVIPAIVVDTAWMTSDQFDLLLMEIAENFEREQPALSDVGEMGIAMLPLAAEAAKRRMLHSKMDSDPSTKLYQGGRALDQIAVRFKISAGKLRMIIEIVTADRDDHAVFGDLVTRMDSSGHVNAVHNELLRRQGRLKPKDVEPDRFPGVSIYTNRKGRTSISINRADGNAVLELFTTAMDLYEQGRH